MAQLSKSDVNDCAGEVCAIVSKGLNDADFVARYLPDRAEGEHPREILFEDDALGFCICGHVYEGQASSGPHDHGPSWAVYGQATGETEMTDWKIVQPSEGDEPARVEPVRTYILVPGDAHLYGIGDVHSPSRAGSTKLIRIEGKNLDTITRSNIAAA